MRTVKGVVMSPRMERLWSFIRERGIGLCDWSTDDDVERWQKGLHEGEEVLVKRASADPENRDLQHLLIDYRTIMNRRPQERATQAQINGRLST